MTDHAALLSPLTGEYREREREEAFRALLLAENVRDTRLLMALAFALNAVFMVLDAHRVGTAIYPAVVAARLAMIAACGVAWRRLATVTRFPAFEREMLLWEVGFALAAAVIVGLTRTEPAIVGIFVILIMHHFAVPLSFRWNAVVGLALGPC